MDVEAQEPPPEVQAQQPPPPRAASVSAVSVKIPPFWPADPAVWFAQVEAQFSNRGIVQSRTRFDHIIAALSPEVATEVRDLILHPPEENPYQLLKDALIQRTEASEQRRLQQLLTSEELGDRKPSQLLRRMQQLLGDSGPPPDSAFVRQLFLQRLPSSVRMVLASSSSTLSLPQLAELADKILEVSTPPAVSSISQQDTSEMKQLTENLSRLISTLDGSLQRFRESTSRHSRASSRSPSNQRSPRSRSASPSLCWYHRTFGSNARKCKPPCARSQSGNDTASR